MSLENNNIFWKYIDEEKNEYGHVFVEQEKLDFGDVEPEIFQSFSRFL